VATIHPTAIVDPKAELAAGVTLGPYSLVGPEVRVGADTQIGSHTILEGRVELGEGCRVGSHVMIGAPPQDTKYHDEPTRVVIGAGTQIREFSSIHRASTGGDGITRVGARCLLMAYVHIAHDCQLGDEVVMANLASLAGHVTIGDHALIGGMTGIHQFVRVGEHAFVGACSGVLQDIPPYVKVQGNRAKPFGLNVVGLRRQGIKPPTLRALHDAYRLIFSSDMNTSQAVAAIEAAGITDSEVRRFVDFIRQSPRGISK
jgi:UDP-N-acetylglucosamine acyltransferase